MMNFLIKYDDNHFGLILILNQRPRVRRANPTINTVLQLLAYVYFFGLSGVIDLNLFKLIGMSMRRGFQPQLLGGYMLQPLWLGTKHSFLKLMYFPRGQSPSANPLLQTSYPSSTSSIALHNLYQYSSECSISIPNPKSPAKALSLNF